MNNALTYLDMTFAGRQIKSAQMAVDTSLNERVLDVDTMNATVESEAALVPFQQNTPVRFLRGGSQYALWYLAQITRVAPKLWALSMTSSLGRLTQMPHKGGIYNGVAASAIIDDICGVVPHFVGAAFQNVLLYGWLPYVAPSGENGAQTGSAKDNLLKVLFALNATVRDDADGTLRIENLPTAVSGQLDADRIYRDNASVVTEPTVTAVTVLEHQYITGSESTTLFEGTTVDGQVIVFREPMSNLSATGFSVTESNANYAVVSAGSGTLTGRPYIHTTREITKPVTAASIPNAVRIEDATLVGVTNSADVVNRLADYYSHRTYINMDATIDFEDAGDVVEIFDPFDRVMRQACIEKISPLVVSQVMKGRVSALVGFTPWQVIPFEDVRELLTGSGTWTVPAGVTQVTAVLIGGGTGGYAGGTGKARPQQTTITETRNYGYYGSTSKGTPIATSYGGEGGDPGAGGEGGKIFRIEITVSPGMSFSYASGVGGEGAPSDSTDAGTAGSASTFGSYSSDAGAASASGYTDAVTGDTYAQVGQEGIAGGKGASYNEPTTTLSYGGSTWSSGSKGPDLELPSRGHYKNSTYGAFFGEVDGSYGGGPAYGANGRRGTGGTGSTSTTSATGRPTTGGKGGDAQPFPKETTLGRGGRGGNGGGGEGACGTGYVGNNWENPAVSGANGLQWIIPAVTYGGAGSKGSDGADGGTILYYRRPVTT